MVDSTTTNNEIRRSIGGGHGTWRSSDNKSIGQMGVSWRLTPCKTGGTSCHSTAKCYRSHANNGVGGVKKEWLPRVNKIVRTANMVESQENANVLTTLDDKGKEGH
ncbi:hypothetical protein MKW92_013646 [Papaver armeniacum]|nr:hypothetical protein MKW92_013646 [Papaver armeniacum]